MPASLSEIDVEISDAESEEDELADDPDAHRSLELDDNDNDKTSDEHSTDSVLRRITFDDNASDDSMDGELGRCEYCSRPLGHNTHAPSRVFRCRECESELQCEKCCHAIHVCKRNHHLQEWDATVEYGENTWFDTRFKQTSLVSKYATRCGVCQSVVAPEARKIPWWALLCEECGCGVMCQRCCFKKHEKHPLHSVKVVVFRLPPSER
ncbi:hypothetical protein B0H11DRAFT_2264339 [Mycena galericulata]|nr:hypothetical protein B0H11DRAFT_2264339 [Mycena galericulata]